MTGLGTSCGACKFLRRKCTNECVFAPYFGYEQAASHFSAVHKVFGASNVSKLLLHLPVQSRSEAAITISYEALARMRDPVYGCFADIFALQQQVASLQEEIETLGNQIVNLAVDVSSRGSPQVTNNANNNDIQFPTELNYMNIQDYIYQENTLLADTVNMPANQFTPIYGWEDQTSASFSDSNPLERLFEGMDHGLLFASCSGMDNGSTNIYY